MVVSITLLTPSMVLVVGVIVTVCEPTFCTSQNQPEMNVLLPPACGNVAATVLELLRNVTSFARSPSRNV